MSKVLTDQIEKRTGGTAIDVPATGKWPTANIADDAITADKLANSINTEIAANTAKVTNATHTGDVTGATALTIAVDAVDIPMLSATGTADATTFLRGDNAWAAAGAPAARYMYAWNTIGGALNASTDTLAPLNGIDQSHSAYDASTYTWTATADDAGRWIFIAQGAYYTSTNNGNDYRVYIFKNGSKSSGSYSWSWQTTNYLRHFTVHNQEMLNIASGDTIQMYGYNAVAGAFFQGDGSGGQKQCSMFGYKL